MWTVFLKEHLLTLKDCLLHEFNGFRNNCLNKISLDNMLYFHNKLYKFWENAWFFDKYAMKNNLQNKSKLPFSSWPVRISVLTTCVIWSCTGNFLIRACDCHICIIYFSPVRQFRSRSAIFSVDHNFRSKVSLNKYSSLNHLSNV